MREPRIGREQDMTAAAERQNKNAWRGSRPRAFHAHRGANRLAAAGWAYRAPSLPTESHGPVLAWFDELWYISFVTKKKPLVRWRV